MTELVIRKSIFLRAKPSTVWEFLVCKEKLELWFHRPVVDLQADSDYQYYRIGENDEKVKMIWGSVTTFEPNKKLIYSFIIPPFEANPSTVIWTLEEFSGGTKLSLEHHGIENSSSAGGKLETLFHLDKGWDEHIARFRSSVDSN